MPEELCVVSDLEKALDYSDDYIFNIHNYQSIQNALDADDNIQVSVVEKLLSFSVRQLKEDMKYTSNVLNIISTVLDKIKKSQFSPLPDLVPSAVGVLHILKTTALFNKVEALKALCFDIILSYPDETLISLVVNQSNELMELINLYCHQRIPLKIRLQILSIIYKLLKILPPEKKATFVKEGLDIWFSKIIPFVSIISALPQVLDVLELLADDLVALEYGDNPHWRVVLENIYTPQKYPTLMKHLLSSNDNNWYRLWIMFIKLLKSQITKSMSNTGSPINSMLPVVEMAFKMDVPNRCKAFLCWNVLIDNFSTETNEIYICKRIKLLVIPLTSNNAKVEETAIVKLNTWWHMICSFYMRIEKISNIVLMPFLYFCFGKSMTEKPMFIPGMISELLKAQCVEAFINICGHVNCEGCVNLPKLKGKLLTPKMLVDNWREWIHFLNNALIICADNDKFTNKQIECMWKSFIKTIGELPENNIRRDLFMEVISLLDKITKDCSPKLCDIILNILIKSLVDDAEIQPLMVAKDDKYCPIVHIVKVVLKLPLNDIECSRAVDNLKPITNHLIKEAFATTSHTIEGILRDLPSNGICFWMALADTICVNFYNLCERMLCKMIMWPLNHLEHFVKEDLATSTWVKLYEYVYSRLQQTKINENVFSILMSHAGSLKFKQFFINASVAAIQKKIESTDNFDNETKWLLKSVSLIDVYEDIKNIFPNLLSVVVNMMNKLCVNKDAKIAEDVILIIEQLLKLYKQCGTLEDSDTHLQLILEELKTFFDITEYSKLVTLLLNEFKSYAVIVKNKEKLRDLILDVLSAGSKDTSVEEVIKLLKENTERNPETPKQAEKPKFTTPGGKTSAKKPKKKEANIVNTVMENGEEYVVVKSNWKFNPRKLTDNQKEKLQRKREDIPALYQDLSQSQDDFKLNTWKTDSQDTTTTSKSTSVAAGNEDVSTILKNIPNSEFVPKILENIIGKDKEDGSKEVASKENTNTEKVDSKTETNKLQIVRDTKSPRLALKDRIFKNVKSLMEKSNLIDENSGVSSKLTENVPKTPTTTKPAPLTHVTNSAPTLLSADRPSRLKRKPKKFVDLQFTALKRRRHSLGQADSPTDGESSDSSSIEANTLESKKGVAVNENKQLQINITNPEQEKETTSKVIITVPDSNEVCVDTPTPVEEHKDDLEKSKTNQTMDVDESAPKTTATDAISLNETQMEEVSVENQKSAEELKTKTTDKNEKNFSTPKPDKNKVADSKSTTKKASSKKSRIEKELAIDMVEGHPFLNTSQTEKRLTRKAILNSPCTRKNAEKLHKNKVVSTKTDKKGSDKDKSISIKESQNNTIDILESQDIIESSQESSITTISVKPNKTSKKHPIVLLEDIKQKADDTQDLIDEDVDDITLNSKDDVELPKNRTVADKSLIDLTENMDTEPVNDDVVIVINDEEEQPAKDKRDESVKDVDIQNTAEALTQTFDSQVLTKEVKSEHTEVIDIDIIVDIPINKDTSNIDKDTIAEDATVTMTESVLEKDSPFKDEEQRKMDFMNNTLEISPIKTLSPLQERKSPPENSEYMVIKLTSPVQGNGEPFEKCESPEIFTEDKSPPRDQSPTREEAAAVNTSPSSSLSLKKNRPQVRSNGRAAQMLGLCVPDIRMDEEKKSPSVNTSARRNLRILYNAGAEQSDGVEDSEESDNFLKFKKLLPSTDCSPSGPILKRKLADITDEATTSPASKRKRVSFHDPPVSTTICVKKYIEPSAVRSPQNSAGKRQERLLRSQLPMKSPKRLENVFKLDSILNKTVESFSENTPSDTEISLSETTPVAEIVKTSELNDIDPLCPELIECKDPISNIATELSSPAMKVLLVKEFEGKIETVGDLAKLTELEINRLTIKAPKLQTARKVLNEYLNKINTQEKDTEDIIKEMGVSENKSVEVQTNVLVENMGMQTDELLVQSNTTQTELPLVVNCSVQTDEAGNSTADIVTTCLSERADFLDNLCKRMDNDSKMKVADNLSFNDLTNTLLSKLTSSNSTQIINRVIEKQSNHHSGNEDMNIRKLCFIKDYLCDNFEAKHLVLFCSDLLKNVYDKS